LLRLQGIRHLFGSSQMKSGVIKTGSGTSRIAIVYTLLLLTSGAVKDTMATVADLPAGVETPSIEATVDRDEVAILSDVRVTTTGSKDASRLPMMTSGNKGLNQLLEATRSPETQGIMPTGLAQTFGVAPPSEAELHGTLSLSATLVDRQTPLSSFAADTASLVEAVAAACIDPASTETCVGTTTLSMRLPRQEDSAIGLPTPVLSVLAAATFGFTAAYRSRRSRPSRRKLSRRSGPSHVDGESDTPPATRPTARRLRGAPKRNPNNHNPRVSMTRNDVSTPA